MKGSIKLSMIIACLVVITGCKKFLAEKAFTNLNQSIFPKTPGDLRVLCNGLYNYLQVNEQYGRSYLILQDVFSDELTTIALSGPRYEMQNALITPVNSEVTQVWQRNYTIIARANVIIKQAPLSGLPTATTAPYVAEAKFIRALCYFENVKFFGDLPLISEAPTHIDSLLALQPFRTNQSEVYKLIIEDLKFAELNLLKESSISASLKGTASTGAAASLLGKVYLTRAYQSFAESSDFTNSADAFNRVIASGTYNLFLNYKDVFDVTKKNGVEHIFSVQYDVPPNKAGAMTAFLSPSGVYYLSFGSFPAERKFYDAFPGTDVIRKSYNFYAQGIATVGPIAGSPYDYLTNPGTNPYCAKYKDDMLAATSTVDRCNYLYLRFADILLMHSEALNRINANDANKYTGINRVRARVNLPPISGLDQTSFQNAVLEERRWELCFEGKRRDDLIRMGKLVSFMNGAGYGNVKDFHKFYPVPQAEIDVNPNLKPQNTGY